ncbi:MAG: hypothetical protein HY329_16030 [Chloroflexi bacterium]|nr:hypothetical protein [Chloroflexota bacterium]
MQNRVEDVQSLARLLLFGTAHTRRTTAERLLQSDDDRWRLLAGTVRSDEPWLLRARCLEVLGLMAAQADRATAEAILCAIVEEPA